MSPQNTIIGVDIGNSGLRLARLRPSSNNNTTAGGFAGPIGRIDWKPRQPDAVGTPILGNRFYSDDPSWLKELDRQLIQIGASGLPAESVYWLVSSVRRDASEILEEYLAQLHPHNWHWATRQDIDLVIEVDFPDRLGIDRLLASYAAMHYCSSRPLIVIQAGSALTVDWVTANGHFAGGAIVPGVPMMLRLLGQGADMLPQIEGRELVELPQLPGKNTEQAMICGVSSALVGGAQHLVARYRSQSSPNVPVILSGGDGPSLAKHLTGPLQVVDQLVLVGLAIVAKRLLAM